MNRKTILAISAIGLCANAAVVSADDESLNFAAPKVIKLDWGIGDAEVCDLNADGRDDVLLINYTENKIDMLLQVDPEEANKSDKKKLSQNKWEPVLSDGSFKKESISLDENPTDIVTGDLNSDGRIDIAFTAKETPLTIRYQDENGRFLEQQTFEDLEPNSWWSNLVVEDIDKDGRNELIVLAVNEFLVLRQGAQELEQPERFRASTMRGSFPRFIDFNDDDRLDYGYRVSDGTVGYVIRLQLENGGFGPELLFPIDRIPRRMDYYIAEDGGQELAFVTSKSGDLDFYEIVEKEVEKNKPLVFSVRPQIYPVLDAGDEGAVYTLADSNGDGIDDLHVADPKSAELSSFIWKDGSFKSPVLSPTLSGITSISRGVFYKDGGNAILVASQQENIFGLSYIDDEGAVQFPRSLDYLEEGDLNIAIAEDLDMDGFSEILTISDEKSDRDYVLSIAIPNDRNEPDEGWRVVFDLELEDVKRDPYAVKVLPIQEGGMPHLMIFVDRRAPVLLAPVDGKREYELFASDSSIRKSLLDDVGPEQIYVQDLDGDGRSELIVAKEGFSRVLRFEDERLELVDQYNSKSNSDTINALFPAIQKGENSGIFYHVSDEEELQFLKKDDSGTLIYNSSEDVSEIDIVSFETLEDGSFLLLGSNQFWHYSSADKVLEMEPLGTRESELDKVRYHEVNAFDFDGDGADELVPYDSSKSVIEILKHEDDTWNSVLYWEVFEANLSYQGKQGNDSQPRDVFAGDFNSDGKLDLGLLVHDRMLYYVQE